MNTDQLGHCTVSELQVLLREREVSATDLAEQTIAKIQAENEELNAFVCSNVDATLQRAADLDEMAVRGKFAGPLHGIPVAVKDNYLTRDMPTSAGSLVEHPHSNAIDAPIIAGMRSDGALIVAKTNMHEWAYGATNEESSRGRTRNPWDLSRITGGSSGGSGAAVAARIVPAALGSDTGGSVRIPSAACGISGIKPTLGSVDVTGVLPLSWSFDVAGPMARSAVDLAILLRSMRLDNHRDANLTGDPPAIRGLRVGRLNGAGFERSEEVNLAVNAAIEHLEAHGAHSEGLQISDMKRGFGAWKVILHSEAATYHGEMLRDQAERYSSGVRTQLEAGRAISATEYLQAQRFRREFNDRVCAQFSKFDVLALPTLPICAPIAGQTYVDVAGERRTAQDSMTMLPWLANFTGLPAVSVPCGFGAGGLPVALSLIGKPGTDFDLLGIAAEYQQLSTWHLKGPEPTPASAGELAV